MEFNVFLAIDEDFMNRIENLDLTNRVPRKHKNNCLVKGTYKDDNNEKFCWLTVIYLDDKHEEILECALLNILRMDGTTLDRDEFVSLYNEIEAWIIQDQPQPIIDLSKRILQNASD